MASQQQNRLSVRGESAPMPAMSLLHRAVCELAELTTFLRAPRFADLAWLRSGRSTLRREGVRHWVIGVPLPGRLRVDSKIIEQELAAETKVNRLHRAISELAQVATFTRSP
jgi:hypothetical protein